jgi:hypothetical protein
VSVRLSLGNVLKAEGLPPGIAKAVVRDLTLDNPEFVSRERRGLWTGDTDETLTLAQERGGALVLPRGYTERLIGRLKAAELEYDIEDKRLAFPAVDFSLGGISRPYQSEALQAMKPYGSGVLVAPCGGNPA